MSIRKIVTTRFVDENSKQEFQFEPVEDTIKLTKTEKDKTYILKYLTVDENPMSPNEWGDESIFLVHYHRNFWIKRKEFPKEALAGIYRDKLTETNDYWIFPVTAYIHSGVSLSLNDSFSCDPGGWDTSHVGAIFTSKKEWPKREDAEKVAESSIKTWNQYLSGEVYCCVKEHLDENKQNIDYDIVGGFFGIEEATECLNNKTI